MLHWVKTSLCDCANSKSKYSPSISHSLLLNPPKMSFSICRSLSGCLRRKSNKSSLSSAWLFEKSASVSLCNHKYVKSLTKLSADLCVLTMHYDPVLSSPQHRILKWNSSGCACLCLEEGQLGSTGPGDGVCHTSGLREGLELEEKCASSSSSLQGHNFISAIPHNISPNTALILW